MTNGLHPANSSDFALGNRKVSGSTYADWDDLGDTRSKTRSGLGTWFGGQQITHVLVPDNNKINQLIAQAEATTRAGVFTVARKLANAYEKSSYTINWSESDDSGFMVPYSETVSSPIYSTEKARYWENVADHLEGKTTPHAREKFLEEFLYSQKKTPAGLYNIGYALYHNPHIGDPMRGMDYLRHAANLGDANAARELGEIFHIRYNKDSSQENLQQAYLWYKAAAELGHPNGKARFENLEKQHPDLKDQLIDEKTARNPSVAHIQEYPESAWYVDVPTTDISYIVNDSGSGLVHRMEAAIAAIDSHVEEFEQATKTLQAQIDEVVQRQHHLDQEADIKQQQELSSLRTNDTLSRQQRVSTRALENSKSRWRKETTGNMASTLVLTYLTGGGIHLVASNTARATGYHAVMDNEVSYQQAIIDDLESQKIDTSRFPAEIERITKEVQRLLDSGPIKRLSLDGVRSRALVEGYLRQQVLHMGLDTCRGLDEYSKMEGLDSVDALLEALQQSNPELARSLTNLCHGHADSRDVTIILEDTNALRGELQPHEKALKQFVEGVVKENVAYYISRASQIDVIKDLKLVDFETMTVRHDAATANLVAVTGSPTAEQLGQSQVDVKTRLALTCMFSKQFGVSHIGQYDVSRIFGFYLHRHGNKELIAEELHDGQVSDELSPKRVSVANADQMQGFVERAKRAAVKGRDDLPNIGDLFLRTCVYEYYLPQAVIASGRGNRFRENPEAPVAYPMVNEVIHDFIRRISLTDIANYRETIGKELDGVIAQTFLDFFQEVGKQHREKFSDAREYLRDAYVRQNYGPRFSIHQNLITSDAKSQFGLFMKLYERNLAKSLQVMPLAEAEALQGQINGLHDNAKDYLAPAVPRPGSHQAREAARDADHRGANMTEQWSFGS